MLRLRPDFTTFLLTAFLCLAAALPAHADMEDQPYVRLRSLDKTSARTMTFDARVGSTVKFGPLFIKTQACRKAPPIEAPEAAAFLQVWEQLVDGTSKWVFSGWMFASSPALSPMDHPVYDVWVLDCLNKETDQQAEKPAAAPDAAEPALSEEDIKKSEELEAAPGEGDEVASPDAKPIP